MSTETPSVEPNNVHDPQDSGDPQHAWLRASLRQVMEELMGSDATSLQKANAIARLGGLYLKTHQTGELEKQNRALKEQIAALERQIAATREETAQVRELVREWSEWWELYRAQAEFPHEGAALPPLDPAPAAGEDPSAARFDRPPMLVLPADAADGYEDEDEDY